MVLRGRRLRSDFLVSVAVVDESGPSLTIPQLRALSASLSLRFQYFEVVYVVSEQARDHLEGMAESIAELANLRIILTSETTNVYRQRLVAGAEAIGDVVALVDLEDQSFEDLATRLCEARDTNHIMLGRRIVRTPNSLAYQLLSLISRHIISTQTARTIILPRERMNAVLARKTAALDLRFEPRSPPSRYIPFGVAQPARRKRKLGHRYDLLTEILMSGAPRYLKAFAGAGFLVSVGAMLYGLYAIDVILLRDHVQEGWFSTAIIQAGSTAFIAGGMSILALAMTAILEGLNGDNHPEIVDEMASTNFFDRITDLNVEIVNGSEARQETSATKS